ncbi:MAG: hypothetical protein ACI9EF_003639 [Pseudohongiellaceae bacterium]|jgi:hypothetical protein
MLTPNLTAIALVTACALAAGCVSPNSHTEDRSTELAMTQTIHALAQEYNDA